MEGLRRAGARTCRSIFLSSSSPLCYTPAAAFATSKAKAAPKKKSVISKSAKSKAAKTPKAKAEPAKGKFDGLLDKYLQPLAHPSEASSSTEEQRQREREMASQYSRLLMGRHRAEMKALNLQIQLKEAAIAALPEDLREAALVPDLTPFPINRFAATLTPPIAGYVEETTKEAQRAAAGSKSR
ncbi:hypothetical protein CBR_g40874 [Chara braunii]|uniref:Uncharacterized protein n=1 Tax=Chara braunii TaxID=69332 RepID=A0A388K293_CHABU|nr:hypothetical protein CBR_g40874 [Chara braunii]|eukprot:GBG64174.1 hypothetical protein CBR_g40874 [Chara braunii]